MKQSLPAEQTRYKFLYILIKITALNIELLDFFYFFLPPVFLGIETRRSENWICFRPQETGGEDTYSVGPLKKELISITF
jgi:hypothetical protein